MSQKLFFFFFSLISRKNWLLIDPIPLDCHQPHLVLRDETRKKLKPFISFATRIVGTKGFKQVFPASRCVA